VVGLLLLLGALAVLQLVRAWEELLVMVRGLHGERPAGAQRRQAGVMKEQACCCLVLWQGGEGAPGGACG